jgi:Membrane domain of glycerophosphoryl diester phosphodiesterase
MPNALYPPLKPRSFGELLDAVLQIFRASLLKCLPYATVAIIAGQLSALYYLARGRNPVLDSKDPVGIALFGVGSLIGVVLWAALLLRQSAIAAGRPVTGAAGLLDTLKQTPAITAIVLLGGAAVAILMLPALALAPPFSALALLMGPWWAALVPAYRDALTVVMLAPALYVGVALSFSLPALVLARKGVLGSLAYSFKLVRGNWWRVAAIYIVGSAAIWTLCVLVATIFTIALSDNGSDDVAITRAISSAAILAVVAIGLTLYSALILALFGDLEVRRMTGR